MAGLGALEIASVRQLSRLEDVNRLLHEANSRERSIDAELEQLLSRRGQLEDSLLALHGATLEVRAGRRALRSGWQRPGGQVGGCAGAAPVILGPGSVQAAAPCVFRGEAPRLGSLPWPVAQPSWPP